MTIDRYESLEYDGRLYSEISDLESKIDDLQHQLEQKELQIEKLKQQNKEIERLNNIIKEVREYIETEYLSKFDDIERPLRMTDKDDWNKILEILRR